MANLSTLFESNREQWLLVGMRIIQTIALADIAISTEIDHRLKNGVTGEDIARDSFSKRLILAYGLSVINKSMYDAFKTLSKIRNNWAHSVKIEMELKELDPVVAALSQKRKKLVAEFVGNYFAHFNFTCDCILEELKEVISATPRP